MTVNEKNAEAKAKEALRVKNGFGRPFRPDAVKFKPQMVKQNRCLAMAYIDARLVQERLDEIVGVNGWQDEYDVLPGGSVLCRLRVFVWDEWICKQDVGSPSEQPDQGDRMKAALSDALKRAAVKFGIGRYLYRLAGSWVDYDPAKKRIVTPPRLPAWAVPKADEAPEHEESPDAPPEPEAPPKAAPDPQKPRNLHFRDSWLDAIKAALKLEAGKVRDRLTVLWKEWEAALAQSPAHPLDKQDVESLFKEAGAKFPKPTAK